MFSSPIKLTMELYFSKHSFVIAKIYSCSILTGTAFHLNWNIIPDDMEQGSILAVTKRVTKKHCLRVKTVLFGSIAFKASYPLFPHAKEERE